MHIRKLFALTLVFLVCSCATVEDKPQFHVSVDSLASINGIAKKTYLLLPGNEGITWDDLQFQEYAIYLMRALNSQGFISAEKYEDADIAIVLSYGIGDPQTTQYSYTLPTWGQTGISSSHTYGTASVYGNTGTYSGTTTYTPSYGVTGYRSQIGSMTTYFRYARITAYDYKAFKETEKQVQLWRTLATSNGSSGDLRRVFPVLIAATAPYLATNTGKQIPVQLYESDKIVRAVKGETVQ